MKKWLWGLVMVFFFCHPVLAEKTIVSEFDGAEWNAWTEAKKFNFLSGFLLGTSHIVKRNDPFMSRDYRGGEIEAIRQRLSRKYDKKGKAPHGFNKDEVILWGHYRASVVQSNLTDYAVYDITVSQLSKGMDDLYKDPKNSVIKLADAVYIVKNQIKGAQRDDIEKTLHFLRGD